LSSSAPMEFSSASPFAVSVEFYEVVFHARRPMLLFNTAA
jgi:hypothetical protein